MTPRTTHFCGDGDSHRVAHTSERLSNESEPELDVLVDRRCQEVHRAKASNQASEKGQDCANIDSRPEINKSIKSLVLTQSSITMRNIKQKGVFITFPNGVKNLTL